MSLKIGELFAGYGGLALGIEQAMDAEVAWYAEYDPAPSKIMAHHYPDLTNYGDVTAVDWSTVPPVDIISGGSPCQDLSLAGARRGMTDGTRSNLWESMREAIAVIKPTYVVWENVRGALSASAKSISDMEPGTGPMGNRDGGHLRALGRVLGDLADLGYDCQWRGLRASGVGAPHGRFRVFILATHRDHIRGNRAGQWAEQDGRGQPAHGGPQTLPDATSNGRNERRAEPTRQQGRLDAAERSASTVADSDHSGPQGQHHTAGTPQAGRHRHSSEGVDWRKYTGAVRRWEALRGASPAPVELSPTGKPRLSPHLAEWMMGLPDGWITDVPGLSWADKLKAAGNGVVPQQAAAALRDMLNREELP